MREIGKYKYLLKNIGLMTINNFASKILSFLLVPLYTRVLTTEEYGIYDLYVITIFLLMPILSLNINDALLRYSLDKTKNPKQIFSITIKHDIMASAVCCLLIFVNSQLNLISVFTKYPVYFCLYFSLSLLSDVMVQFARGLEQILDVAVAGILSSASMMTMNILMLLVFKKGLEGYFIAYCTSYAITILYLVIRLKAWHYFSFKGNYRSLKKEMTKYSIPLILNSIGWWINNASDKYVVTWLCGTAANGVFSVAYKIPSILTMFQTIFNQAWAISAVKEFDESNKDFYSNIYKVYNFLMVFVCSGLIVFNKVIAKILFANDFYEAWKYAPFLLMAVLFNSLSIFLGGIFAASKKSNIHGKTTLIGAVVNVIANIILVLIFGAIGAAAATMISNLVVWIMRFKYANEIIKLNINLKRDIISYAVLNVQIFIMLFVNNNLVLWMAEFFCLIIVFVLYINDLSVLKEFVISKLKEKKMPEKQ